jgi:DNA invertase Pin-like site-specific DNA recombinase
MFHITSAFAELEREIICERIKAAMATARKKGKHVGPSPPPPPKK